MKTRFDLEFRGSAFGRLRLFGGIVCNEFAISGDGLRNLSDRYPLECAESASVLADSARAQDRLDEAASYAVEAWRLLSGGRARGDWMNAAKEVRVGRSLLAAGMLAPAEELLQSGHDVFRIQLGEKHSETLVARALLHELYIKLDQPRDAQRFGEIPAGGD